MSHDTPATGNVLSLINLHMRESNELADDGLYSFHTIGTDTILVNFVSSFFYGFKDNGQRFFVADTKRLQHHEICIRDLFRITSDSFSESLIVIT